MMGSDYYETEESVAQHRSQGKPSIGIGQKTMIETAIIDKNARVGNGCAISPAGKPRDMDHPLYFIRDGIVIIPKNGTVPDGTVI
jgi:glucose-1-phosphate adenylyltransferase